MSSAGKKVLGGGFDIETPTFVKVFSSEASDGAGNFINNGWNVMATNTDTNHRPGDGKRDLRLTFPDGSAAIAGDGPISFPWSL